MNAMYEQLEEKVLANNPAADVGTLRRTYEFAEAAHAGQKRKSGEPFIAHPLAAALILADLKLDLTTIQAGLLHDAVEDSDDITTQDITEAFGPEVAQLVDGVTKLGMIDFETTSDQQSESMRKMLIAMARDIRVILIKLADRLHNMRTLGALRPERQIAKARETMDIFAPLAHRLGISQIKWELEDRAFSYLDPVKYEQVSRMVSESRDQRNAYADQVMEQIQGELDSVHITSEISGRPKHLYSIYQKMINRGKDFSEIYDLIALRIIVDSIKDVYGALGTVHSLYKPIPGRFKDYVAMPKFNMYQSLHTTVIGPSGRPLEIQIRTEEMHRMAEYGVAAHWRYKERSDAPTDQSFDERLAWLRQMLEWQTDLQDPQEFMEALKIDLFEEEVFVFTPKGDVKSLKRGATPLDFAYSIHSEVGSHCVGAKVNGQIVPLAHELEMGDRVEILTSKTARPSRDWLNIVQTSSAKSKIKNFLSKTTREDDLIRGRDELSKAFRKHGVALANKKIEKATGSVAKDMNFVSSDDLFAQIGSGRVSAKLIATRVLKDLSKDGLISDDALAQQKPPLASDQPMAAPRSARRNRPNDSIIIKGIDHVLIRLSKCCNPVPGDSIIGFVTRGRGVSVHRTDCPNAAFLKSTSERLIEVSWDSEAKTSYNVEILVQAVDRLRLLQELTIHFSESGVNILSSSSVVHRDGTADLRFLIEIGEMSRLDTLLAGLRGVEGVFVARRANPGETVSKKN